MFEFDVRCICVCVFFYNPMPHCFEAGGYAGPHAHGYGHEHIVLPVAGGRRGREHKKILVGAGL
jgi:hypothetical protein